MKKVIIGLVLLAAMMSNAATCKWGFSKVTLSSKHGTATDYVAYLCDAGVTALTTMESALAEKDFQYLAGNTLIASNDGVAGTSVAGLMNKTISSFSTSLNENPLAGDSFSFYVILLNNSMDKADEYYVIGPKTAEVGGDLSLSMTFGSQENNTATWKAIGGTTDVPEPTSGLLLLVGGALLALRRRQK